MAKDNTKVKTKSGLRKELTKLAIAPLFFMGIIVMIVTYFAFYKTMSKSVEHELERATASIGRAYGDIYDDTYSFSLAEDGSYALPDELLGVDTAFVDEVRQLSGLDITLFYYDIRVITTITDKAGNSLAGSVANKKIVDKVLGKKEAIFVDNVDINGVWYFGYYAPVLNDSLECVGMIFAGKPTNEIKKTIMLGVSPVFALVILMMLITSCKSAAVARKLAEVINKEKNFLGEIASGNLKASLDAGILKRDDELGDMGLFTVKVQKFIRDMIERDTLTKLYTRRIGEVKLMCTRQEYIDYGSKYCMVMCDIDHFKRFNDTYGHDCGDLVLQSVANIFNRLLFGKGYAVRWGGEEFILIIDNSDIEKALPILNEIRDAIIENEVVYNEEHLKVTMTFGIISGDDRELAEMIKEVDNLLYIGKEAGRNRIVVENEEAATEE